jgi:hypothetical protein
MAGNGIPGHCAARRIEVCTVETAARPLSITARNEWIRSRGEGASGRAETIGRESGRWDLAGGSIEHKPRVLNKVCAALN